ncbi:MAG: hypothetical protein J5875_02675 [Paludibacteraceae bacterium]|nr:hypothetical protein [Paludibacteraceae bacterium]
MDYTFEEYWDAIQPDAKFANREEAAREEWDKHPEKHAAIMRWLKIHGAYPNRNPYFFIQDFTVRADKTEPTNYNGRALPNEPTTIALYNGKWGTYTLADIDKFQLQTTNDQ